MSFSHEINCENIITLKISKKNYNKKEKRKKKERELKNKLDTHNRTPIKALRGSRLAYFHGQQ